MANEQSNQAPNEQEKQVKLNRDYGMLLNTAKYNRNFIFKKHDNAYGIKGGGGAKERKECDLVMLEKMKAERDPLALPTYLAIRLLGWFFFNYHRGKPWKGQLIKKLFPRYLKGK